MELRKEQRRMKYEGKAIQTVPLDGGFVELRFDLQGDSVNKFNSLTLGELKEVVAGLVAAPPKGLLITSGKDVFIVGADVTEFLTHFRRSEEELAGWLLETDATFSAIEDLPCPSVVAINGFCLGGGFELALSAH
ncbi:MAG TPA: enoyl-CoA hydratase-related protein, partial [Thermoanaerobaculia bacterium]|nr:enoyl-CoA hydratase-related protein [Thermoanaerobaculia bacterium]